MFYGGKQHVFMKHKLPIISMYLLSTLAVLIINTGIPEAYKIL